MKGLNSSLKYSASHVRRTVRTLEAEGLIECRPDPLDGRNARVLPTAALLGLMGRFGQAAETAYCGGRTDPATSE